METNPSKGGFEVNTEALTHRTFREWCRWYRKNFPVSRPVRIIRRPINKKHCAEAWVYESRRGLPKKYVIVLDVRMDRVATQDALIHEWAHILRCEAGADIEKHDAEFWRTHGKVYRKWNETK